MIIDIFWKYHHYHCWYRHHHYCHYSDYRGSKIYLCITTSIRIQFRDVYRSLVASKELIYITGWSVWTGLRLIRRQEEVNMTIISTMLSNRSLGALPLRSESAKWSWRWSALWSWPWSPWCSSLWSAWPTLWWGERPSRENLRRVAHSKGGGAVLLV